MTKQCKGCGEVKPLEHYYPRRDGKRDGRLNRCIVCHRISVKEFRAKHPHRRKVYDKKYRKVHAEKIKKVAEQWVRNNLHKRRAYGAKARATLINATPQWVVDDPAMLAAIEQVFKDARELEHATGMEWHVDHIEPLKGKDRCGLHVPWNLRPLTRAANVKKGNRVQNLVLTLPPGHSMSLVQSFLGS